MTPILKVRFSADVLREILASDPDFVIITSGLEVGIIEEERVAYVKVIAEGFANAETVLPEEAIEHPEALMPRLTASGSGCPIPPCKDL